jgi:hypothetical protein
MRLFEIAAEELFAACEVKPFQAYDPDLPALEWISTSAIAAVEKAAAIVAKRTWQRLTRCLDRHGALLTRMRKEFPQYDDTENLLLHHKMQLPGMVMAVERALRAAAYALAKGDAETFTAGINDQIAHLPLEAARAAFEGLISAHDRSADTVMDWLASCPRLMALGSRSSESEWDPARKLIARFSPHCSDQVFASVEKAILGYSDPGVPRSVKRKAEYGNGPNEFGRAQHVLLSAMQRLRLSPASIDRLGMLDRKFRPYPLVRRSSATGGRVVSTIPPESLPRISDRQWLRIIAQDLRGRDWRWKQMGPKLVGESSHSHFSDDMGEMAKREPSRFAKLAVRIPKGSFPGYLSHIVDALSLRDPPDTIKEAASSWEPATASEIEAVLDYVGYSEDRDQAMSYCRFVKARADADWSESALQQLARYAIEHPHPGKDEWTVGSHDSKGNTIPDVVNTSINCVRGCAVLLQSKTDTHNPRQGNCYHASTASGSQVETTVSACSSARSTARAAARRARASSIFRSRSAKTSSSRPSSFVRGVTYPIPACRRSSL